MKKPLSNKRLLLIVSLVCVAIAIYLLVVPLLVDHDGLRAGLGKALGELTEEYTPEQAAADDCLVVNCDNITAGSARWNWFRFKVALRIPAAIRICDFFSSGEQSFIDLTYTGREFAMHYPDRPAHYARYLKYSRATNPYRTGYESQNTYYLSTAPNGSWIEYMYGTLSADGDMPDYSAYLLFFEQALP